MMHRLEGFVFDEQCDRGTTIATTVLIRNCLRATCLIIGEKIAWGPTIAWSRNTIRADVPKQLLLCRKKTTTGLIASDDNQITQVFNCFFNESHKVVALSPRRGPTILNASKLPWSPIAPSSWWRKRVLHSRWLCATIVRKTNEMGSSQAARWSNTNNVLNFVEEAHGPRSLQSPLFAHPTGNHLLSRFRSEFCEKYLSA